MRQTHNGGTAVDWDRIRIFYTVAESGSFTKAGDVLGLSQSAVSRQIGALERELRAPLFHRHTRGLILTEQGELLWRAAREMTQRLERTRSQLSETREHPSGELKVTATRGLGGHWLTPRLAEFMDLYPDIKVDLILTDEELDLSMREADIAIRHVRPTEPELIGRLIGELAAHLYASDAWIARHGLPRAAADLVGATVLAFDPVEQFVGHMELQGIRLGPEQCSVVSNSASALWEMTHRGIGVGVVLDIAAARMPGLRKLLPELSCVPVPLWLVTHRELQTSRRIRLVYDVVADELRRLVVSGADPNREREPPGASPG